MSPQSIAHYRIVAKLGEGGMGAVYRATDTRLNRDVAIKVLPSAFAEDPGRMQRFEREAQLLAALNHPNIAAIYGVEQGAIVMELVEGAEPAGPLPAATVLDYARQIAAGLEAAHEKGIVHRDLKPANIKVTPDGVVKLLDFGLAKATEASPAPSNATISPTLSLSMTQAGMILGTAAYMSPEQARGKPVDKRADIWAFGVILYELLTGRHPYGTGETVADTLAHIVLKEPDLAALPAGTPPRLRRLIERCLHKDPKLRLRDIGEARILLDTPEPEAAMAVAPAAGGRSWIPWAIAGLAVAVAAGFAGRGWMQPVSEPSPGVAHFLVPLPPGTAMPLATAAAQWVPSPDGKLLALIANDAGGIPSLWVRPLNSPGAYRIDKTEGAQLPFWSPDSRFIAFFADDKLKRVPVSGGGVQTLCELGGAVALISSGSGGAWGPDGTIVFSAPGKPLQRVPAAGGTPTPVTSLDKDDRSHSSPQFLPDGKHFLYLARSENSKHATYVQELGSPNRTHVLDSPTRAVWSPPGYLLFTRDGTLFAQRMDPKSFRLVGEATPLAEDVVANNSNGRSTIALSSNGVLVYRTGRPGGEKQLTWRDRSGQVQSTVGKPAFFSSISLSPDGKSLATILGTERGYDLWLMDLSTGVMAPRTNDGPLTTLFTPAWSRDSRRVAVSVLGGGILEIDAASGKTTAIVDKAARLAIDWLPDGRSLLCADDTTTRLSLLTLGEPLTVTPILTTAFVQNMYRVSPDGKQVAYSSRELGAPEIYVAYFPSFAGKRRVSTSGGQHPVWAKGGKELLFRVPDGTIMAAEVRGGATIETTTPRPLFKFVAGALSNFSATADGERLLIAELVQQGQPDRDEIHVVLNWQAALERR